MTTSERFIVVMAELMAVDIDNSDPMRYSKRCAVNFARKALDDGIAQAEESLRLVRAIEHDTKGIIVQCNEV